MYIINITVKDSVTEEQQNQMFPIHAEWFKKYFQADKFLMLGPYTDTDKQEKLSDEMISLWANAGNAVNGTTKWQKFDPKQGNYLVLKQPSVEIVSKQYAKAHHCEFWDKVGLY